MGLATNLGSPIRIYRVYDTGGGGGGGGGELGWGVEIPRHPLLCM